MSYLDYSENVDKSKKWVTVINLGPNWKTGYMMVTQ